MRDYIESYLIIWVVILAYIILGLVIENYRQGKQIREMKSQLKREIKRPPEVQFGATKGNKCLFDYSKSVGETQDV